MENGTCSLSFSQVPVNQSVNGRHCCMGRRHFQGEVHHNRGMRFEECDQDSPYTLKRTWSERWTILLSTIVEHNTKLETHFASNRTLRRKLFRLFMTKKDSVTVSPCQCTQSIQGLSIGTLKCQSQCRLPVCIHYCFSASAMTNLILLQIVLSYTCCNIDLYT